MKKYLITGVNGFVGHYFVEYLKKNEPSANILGIGLSSETDINDIVYQQINLKDKDCVSVLLNNYRPDYIIHLAAMSSVAQSWQEPHECFVNNTTIFLNIVDAIRVNNIKTRILSVGSSEEYGVYDIPIKENFILHPKSPYSIARLSQEYLSKLYVDRYGLDIVMTRSFNHIGPKQSDRFVIPSFIKQLVAISKGSENKLEVGNIEVSRDFLDVRDVVDAYYKILKNAPNRSVYNVCSGNEVKLKEIIERISKMLCIVPNIVVNSNRIRPNDVLFVIGDNTKLKTELGWEKKYNLDETLRDMIEYWKNNRD